MGYEVEMSVNKFKLRVLAGAILIGLISLLIFINLKLIHISCLFPIGIFSVPILTILISMLLNIKVNGWRNKLCALKFNRYFPLYFYNSGKQPCLENVAALKEILQQGDVLLRRHKNHVDGLILGQTSYFTHAAIYHGTAHVKDPVSNLTKIKEHQILHAVGSSGVGYEDLGEFCKCEHIAVMRFTSSPEKIAQRLANKIEVPISFLNDRKEKISDLKGIKITDTKQVGVWANKALPIDAKNFIQAKKKSDTLIQQLEDEWAVYTNLENNIIKKEIFYEPRHETYLPLIKEQAEFKIGAPYDFNFNFIDFETLSCVEYVWYCYKCLFPLHQIKRKEFTYFGWVRAFVLVPDMFLVNSFFKLEYTSVPGMDKSQNKLKRHARSHLVSFWRFIFTLVIWEIGLLFTLYFAYLLCKGR